MLQRNFWSSATFTILLITFFLLSAFAISKYFERAEIKEQVGRLETSKENALKPRSGPQRRLDR
jgi:hypothetical protein